MKKTFLATGLAGLLQGCESAPTMYSDTMHDLRKYMDPQQLYIATVYSAKDKLAVWKYKDHNENGKIEPIEIALVVDREALEGTQVNAAEKNFYDQAQETIDLSKGEHAVIAYYTKGEKLPKGEPLEFAIYDQTGKQILEQKLESIGWEGTVWYIGYMGQIKGGNFLYSGPIPGITQGHKIPEKTIGYIQQNPGTYTVTARSTQGYMQDTTQITFR